MSEREIEQGAGREGGRDRKGERHRHRHRQRARVRVTTALTRGRQINDSYVIFKNLAPLVFGRAMSEQESKQIKSVSYGGKIATSARQVHSALIGHCLSFPKPPLWLSSSLSHHLFVSPFLPFPPPPPPPSPPPSPAMIALEAETFENGDAVNKFVDGYIAKDCCTGTQPNDVPVFFDNSPLSLHPFDAVPCLTCACARVCVCVCMCMREYVCVGVLCVCVRVQASACVRACVFMRVRARTGIDLSVSVSVYRFIHLFCRGRPRTNRMQACTRTHARAHTHVHKYTYTFFSTTSSLSHAFFSSPWHTLASLHTQTPETYTQLLNS